jgi:hypothetical protein
MRASNSLVSTLKTNLLESGSYHDLNNNSQFLNYAPSWVIEEHENEGNDNLKIISHVMGAYFDKMYLLTSQLPELRQLNYTTASHAPVPFASHLPQSLGLYSPEIFVDATILERFENRTDKALFESQLTEAKNLIYLNLYNNLTSIYKSKGTSKAVRNVLRCFNLDDSLIKMRVYQKNSTYQLKNNIEQYVLDRTTLNYNQSGNIKGVVYQRLDSTNANSRGYLSASTDTTGHYNIEAPFGATVEASFTLPNFFSSNDVLLRTFNTSSLFGMYQAKTSSADERAGNITTTLAYDKVNFHVLAIRESEYSKNIYFKLTSSTSPYPFPTLTSSVFLGAYNDSDWNVSVRLKPKIYPLTTEVSGTLGYYGYDVIFRGINTILGTIRNSFELTGVMSHQVGYPSGYDRAVSYTSGSNFLNSAKRLYVGARRTNITGATINPTDVRFHNAKYWTKFIGNTSLDQHLYDPENAGVSGSYRDISPKDATLSRDIKYDLTNANTLALEWNFENVTASDGTGNFQVIDFSSGSALVRNNYGWLGNVAGWQHTGYGYGFATSSATVVQKQLTNMYKFIDPEQVVSSDMIQILDKDDEVFGVVQTVPSFIYAIEKSQYAAISEEMLKFFAGVIDFHNIIGEPINRYRYRYKALEKLRETFFRRVTTITEVEKFVEYYKWFDDAISEIVSQLVPASSDLISGVLNTIEPTVLERPKYETKYPTLDAKHPDPEAPVAGEAEATWDATLDRTTLPSSPRDTRRHVPFWKYRAIRSADEISAARFVGAAAAAIIDAQREKFRKVIVSAPHMSRSAPTFFDVATTSLYTGNEFRINTLSRLQKFKVHRDYNTHGAVKGGTNFDADKNIHFTYAALHPAGPIDQSGTRFVPQNILLAFMEDLVQLPYDNDPRLPTEKIKRYLKVNHGRDSKDGVGYEDAKSSMVFPFNLISPVTQSDTTAGWHAQKAFKTGYQKQVYEKLSQSIQITNLHNDVYGPDMEVPMQGPFTNYAVGGHQSRHVPVNYSSSTRQLDTWSTRPEAWKILLGSCVGPSGAIGMVGPDYPTPDGNTSSSPPYPATLSQKAVYYRDMIAKSPVNIRNIRLTTGSTILGNYRQTREYVQTVGAWSNPRHFVKQQPTLPANVIQGSATSSTSTNTILDMPRLLRPGTVPAAIEDKHFTFVGNYSTSYLTAALGSAVIISRFSNHGGPEVQNRGHQDFKSSEYSVYNSLNFKNLTVIKPSQGPSGTISETEGIRVSDIHGKDYGLRSQLARHTARFGRDSLFVTSSVIAYGNAAPGGTYNQLPGFHKVHRNNLQRIKPVETITYGYSTVTYNNSSALEYHPSNYAPTLADWSAAGGVSALVGAVTGSTGVRSMGFTWTGWLNFAAVNLNVEEPVFSLGLRDGPVTAFTIAKRVVGDNWMFFARARVQDTYSTPSSEDWLIASATWAPSDLNSTPWTGSWNHFAVTWHAQRDGTIASTEPATIYFNGVSQSVTTVAPLNYFANTAATVNPVRDFAGLSAINNDIVFHGGDFGVINVFTGSMDEVTIWKVGLNATQVKEIYNSGYPCDITQSATYDTYSAFLYEWYPMQGGVGSSEMAINGSNPGTYSAGSNSVLGFKGIKTLPLAIKTQTNKMAPSTGPTGCTPSITGATTTTTYNTSDYIYDNFFVKHPIPRSSKQYKWIADSIVNDRGWIGFTPADFTISSSTEGNVSAYLFVSQSDFGSYKSGGSRVWGNTYAVKKNRGFVPTAPDLNFNLYEPITTSTNTVGYPTTVPLADALTSDPQYVNREQVSSMISPASEYSAYAFNALMTKRNGLFGYPSWQQMRYADNPILQGLRKANVVSMMSHTLPRGELARYNMPVVSMEGRPMVINYTLQETEEFTLVSTHNNESVYFPSVDMANEFDINFNYYETPFEQLLRSVRTLELSTPTNHINWVLYTQKLFPSSRNEFTTGSNTRLNYDNRFWRDGRVARNSKNIVTASLLLKGAPDANWIYDYYNNGNFASVNSYNQWVKESAWPLDAPDNFMDRTMPPYLLPSTAYPGTVPELYRIFIDYKGNTGSAGELQNTYTNFFSGNFFFDNSGLGGTKSPSFYRGRYSTSAPLYARKHLISNPRSFVAPTGIQILQTGSWGNNPDGGRIPSNAAWLTGNWSTAAQVMPIGGGEALWEAGSTAGVVRRVPGTNQNSALGTYTSEFQLSSSEPWFDKYEDFRYQLKLMAKDYAIIPEYRISEHIEEYTKYGIPLTTELTIPGALRVPLNPTSSVASVSGQPDFYKDYSNSEFLQDFLQIKEETLLDAKQIRLVCSAAIRYNPYEGFYPVQRTTQLVDQFRKSYEGSFHSALYTGYSAPLSPLYFGGGTEKGEMFYPNQISTSGNFEGPLSMRPLAAAMFSPGLLYNSIKSGMAVDYPIVEDSAKFQASWFPCTGSSGSYPGYGRSAADTGGAGIRGSRYYNTVGLVKGPRTEQNYAMGFGFNIIGNPGSKTLPPIHPEGASPTKFFFDKRIPFEALLRPAQRIGHTTFYDFEPNPSASLLRMTCSFVATADDSIYTKMADNFFGQVGQFFLSNNDYTSISSNVIESGQRFESGAIYMSRLKLRRSTSGSRTYENEGTLSGIYHNYSASYPNTATPYGIGGGKAYNHLSTTGAPCGIPWSYASGSITSGSTFPLPQDPVFAGLSETFTMYSRPTAFGPELTGRLSGSNGASGVTASFNKWGSPQALEKYYPLDCFNGFNWAYTPPYYHGEAWCDLIFRPSHTKSYDLEQIMAETTPVYWRCDAGQMSGACGTTTYPPPSTASYDTRLIHGDYFIYACGGDAKDSATILGAQIAKAPYQGNQINRTAMQISAAINIFGIEDVPYEETTVYPPAVTTTSTPAGKRWIIKPKFETPMLNFNDKGIHALTKSTAGAADPSAGTYISIPNNLSASAPRGMWHQFGVIPDKPSVGVFLEIADVPAEWLRNHYLMLNTGSVYNNYTPTLTETGISDVYTKVKSLSSLVGFDRGTPQRRLGELSESQIVKEAIVAIPYITETIEDPADTGAEETSTRKRFIQIPPERFMAAMSATESAEGDSLEAAGASIRLQLQKMQRYVLPPNLDFLNDRGIPPFAMYLFEFEYSFDRDDLSYIWQNIAPRNYKKVTFQASSVAHELINRELLDESVLAENENLRWMVFKVKQRAEKQYWDLIPSQVGAETAAPRSPPMAFVPPESLVDKLGYNWPYDYLSFVELIKMEAQILYQAPDPGKESPELTEEEAAGGGT